MDEKIDLDRFARLMRTPAVARTDILEFLGQASVSLSSVMPVETDGALGGTDGEDGVSRPRFGASETDRA